MPGSKSSENIYRTTTGLEPWIIPKASALETVLASRSHLCHFCSGGPRRDLFDQLLIPARAFRQPLPQPHEVDLTLLFAAVMERAETGVGLGHHVKRQPCAAAFAIAVPVLELMLAQALDRPGQAVRHGVEQLRAHIVHGVIQQFEINGPFR